MAKKMAWDVTISEAENGYMVRVGCRLFVFETGDRLLAELTAYMNGTETPLSKRIREEMPTCQEVVAPPPQGIGGRLTDSVAQPR